MDMRFGTWNVRGLYRAGSLKIVASKLVKYVKFRSSGSIKGRIGQE
jgi:hypothetical protein